MLKVDSCIKVVALIQIMTAFFRGKLNIGTSSPFYFSTPNSKYLNLHDKYYFICIINILPVMIANLEKFILIFMTDHITPIDIFLRK